MLRKLAGMAWMVIVLSVAHRTASAQSFGYRHITSCQTVPFVFGTAVGPEDFELDAWGTINPSAPAPFAGQQRLQANLSQRYRVLANPWVRQVQVSLSRSSFDPFATAGGTSGDRLELDWFYASTPNQITNTTSAITLPPPTGTDSLMFPGSILRVVTGPDSVRSASTPEHESWGFLTQSILACPNGSQGNATWPTLAGC